MPPFSDSRLAGFVRSIPLYTIHFLRSISLYFVYSLTSLLTRWTVSVKSWWRETRRAGWRGQLNLTNLLRLIWIGVVYWGEIGSFTDAVAQCKWSNWERWPKGANPTHAVLIADPQLVDPHTYVRSKPAMAATMYYIDRYLSRTYKDILSGLDPAAVIFLGDLFDGGREWDTKLTADEPGGTGQGERAHMNDAYWHQEYKRFQRIFPNEPGVLTIKSLPGNHDLGFGKGIQPAVYERFRTYFGETNSVWEIGNHSFVLVDTVSLSDDRQDGDGWRVGGKAKQWLDEYSKGMHQPMPRTTSPRKLMSQQIQLADEKESTESQPPPQQNMFSRMLPSILITHVPLYRGPNVPCGPLRESKLHGGGIPFRAGYQYANVLSHDISRDLLQKISPTWVFSGDDHDYCVHQHAGVGDPGKGIRTGRWGIIKEITVKSISWCMGIRKPGILLVSLYNPDERDLAHDILVKNFERNQERQRHAETDLETEYGINAQTHLCLLPDQLGIFILYGGLLAWTLIILSIKVQRLTSVYHHRSDSSISTSPSSSSSSKSGKHGNPSLFISPDKANFNAKKQEPLLPLATPTPTTATFAYHQHTLIPAVNGTTTSTLATPPLNTVMQKPRISATASGSMSPGGSRSSSPRPSGGYGYYSGKHELEPPTSGRGTPSSDHDEERRKYRKEADPQVFAGMNQWISQSAAGDAVGKSREEAKRWLDEKSFTLQKVMQTNAVGRQAVKVWRKSGGGFRCCCPGWLERRTRGIRSALWAIVLEMRDISVVVLPVYWWFLTSY
ncbi:Cell division control protein [Drechslerella dactyloides]|uniref:Cell division control protein n=1 Tax=Drechslerella dactyloides TaxID=74499 RepID=A0AAD6IWF8_DREDA|nr:Cell division control protein [Drechslerella dactyloides]